MSIIKVNIPGDAWIDAKAGENVIAKLGYERLSWIRVVTERPVDLTIKTQTGDDRRTTRKEPSCNCFATEKMRSILTRPERSAILPALCSTKIPARAFTTKDKEEIPCTN